MVVSLYSRYLCTVIRLHDDYFLVLLHEPRVGIPGRLFTPIDVHLSYTFLRGGDPRGGTNHSAGHRLHRQPCGARHYPQHHRSLHPGADHQTRPARLPVENGSRKDNVKLDAERHRARRGISRPTLGNGRIAIKNMT